MLAAGPSRLDDRVESPMVGSCRTPCRTALPPAAPRRADARHTRAPAWSLHGLSCRVRVFRSRGLVAAHARQHGLAGLADRSTRRVLSVGHLTFWSNALLVDCKFSIASRARISSLPRAPAWSCWSGRAGPPARPARPPAPPASLTPHTSTHTNAHARTHTRTQTNAHTHARPQTHPRTHANACKHTDSLSLSLSLSRPPAPPANLD